MKKAKLKEKMKKLQKHLDKSKEIWLNIRCHCVKALFWLYSNTLPEKFRISHNPE